MGNSAGVILPRPIPAGLGVKAGDELSLPLKKGRLVLTAAGSHPRKGWAEASMAIAAAGDDTFVWPERGCVRP
jgi:antitoxin MazE